MCQQFYVIRKMPAPGSLAEKAMQERRLKKGKPIQEFTVKGLDKPDEVEAPKASGQRVQPSRNKKKKGSTGGSAAKKPTGGSTTDPKPQTDN
jgi:YidC/Oxa1 family membrane protein insertase